MKHVLFTSAILLMLSLGNAAAASINLMDTSGGTALVSPAVNFVAGYPLYPPAKMPVQQRARPRHPALNLVGQPTAK